LVRLDRRVVMLEVVLDFSSGQNSEMEMCQNKLFFATGDTTVSFHQTAMITLFPSEVIISGNVELRSQC